MCWKIHYGSPERSLQRVALLPLSKFNSQIQEKNTLTNLVFQLETHFSSFKTKIFFLKLNIGKFMP